LTCRHLGVRLRGVVVVVKWMITHQNQQIGKESHAPYRPREPYPDTRCAIDVSCVFGTRGVRRLLEWLFLRRFNIYCRQRLHACARHDGRDRHETVDNRRSG
jgi:hypothetical protein